VVGGLAAARAVSVRRYAIGAGARGDGLGLVLGRGGVLQRPAASNDFYALTLGVSISITVAGLGTLSQWESPASGSAAVAGPGELARPRPVIAASFAGEAGLTAPVQRAVLRHRAPAAADGGPRVGPPSRLRKKDANKDQAPLSRRWPGATSRALAAAASGASPAGTKAPRASEERRDPAPAAGN